MCLHLYVISCNIYHLQALTHLSFELFFICQVFKLICVYKLVDHPYFTRSKAPKDSFPANLQKEKTTMGDNNEEIDMNDVAVAQPVAADKNELIMQLMQ